MLEDKAAIITGAASARGIGLATARLFTQHGARVAVLDVARATLRRASDLASYVTGAVVDVNGGPHIH